MLDKSRSLNLNQRIQALHSLGEVLNERLIQDKDFIIARAIAENGWFTEASITKAIGAVTDSFLDRNILENWTNRYHLEPEKRQTVGLILAGNIPLVGIHDILSVFVSGHRSLMKFSSKDKVLIPYMISILNEIDPRTTDYFQESEQLKGMDAVIATGGETASTHFAYYFSKYPSIIRGNRSSCAVLTGEESQDDLEALGADIFDYFGLGCRSVSKLYLPRDYNTDQIFEAIVGYGDVIDHNKYKNNFDYSYSIYLLGQTPFLTNNFVILREDEALSS